MTYEVEVSEQADSDLRGIFEYIAFELQSPENASGQLDRLEEQILSLDTMPERYRKYEKEPSYLLLVQACECRTFGDNITDEFMIFFQTSLLPGSHGIAVKDTG